MADVVAREDKENRGYLSARAISRRRNVKGGPYAGAAHGGRAALYSQQVEALGVHRSALVAV